MSTIVQPDDQTISQQRAVPTSIRKRDGRVIRFDSTKIVEAVRKAFVACGMGTSELHASEVALEVMSRLSEMGLCFGHVCRRARVGGDPAVRRHDYVNP